eukprot:CAMPEP_0179475840 /NCGR_PEP_ID=MMETSP0799-20121207/54953_1 /TAXON_ID=46947 /ORGANISM="Geminigera cryophila, Strain CCMP2564" /LENGTH=40 /DNA_ID= /DNA_START= /DNA_END= /DNA_ORIENTATION=
MPAMPAASSMLQSSAISAVTPSQTFSHSFSSAEDSKPSPM